MTPSPRQVLLTTDPGLEDLVIEELREACAPTAVHAFHSVAPGEVCFELDAPSSELLALATAHHVIEVLGESPVEDLDGLRRFVSRIDVPALEHAASFRVSSRCAGDSPLERMEVQRAAGAVLHGRYGTPVDLTGFDVHIRVDCAGRRARLGVQLTREPLSNRVRRGAALRSSLRPTVAAAMIRLAGAHRGPGRLIDPMCGAGVIPVEAARLNPALEVAASDWDEPTVAVAAGTFANHGLAIVPGVLDARSLSATRPGAFDYIVTDPPYGVRQGKKAKLGALYRDLLTSFSRALEPSGTLVLVVVRHRAFERALSGTPLCVVHRRVVSAGTLPLSVFVLRRQQDQASADSDCG